MTPKQISYELWCNHGYLGSYDTEQLALDWLYQVGNEWMQEGVYMIKRQIIQERISIPC